MPKVSPLQSNFNGGEFSPLLMGRVDSERYKTGLETCLNYLPMIQGGLDRRSGSYYVSEVKTSAKQTRLVSFEFSTTQAYILEFGDQYIRFYKDYGQITSGGSAYEIASPYLEADLFQLKFTQSADTLYIVHTGYAPQKLTRTAHTSWTLTQILIKDGPFLTENIGSITLSPNVTTGTSATITASSALFSSGDVGRLIRIYNGATPQWGWAKVTSYVDSTHVVADIYSDFGATTATGHWCLGVWSTANGYPGCVTFHEDRLVFSGVPAYPQRIDGSVTGDYENFAPSDTANAIAADNAYNFTLNSNEVNVMRWLVSDEKGLLGGSVGGEWLVRPSSQNEAISPTNVSAKQSTTYGSANLQPVKVGKAVLFPQRSGKKIRELMYSYDVDGFRAADMSQLAEHITGAGITQMALQREAQQVVWMVRSDGVLLAMTYERDSESVKVGWSRHILGGQSDAAGSDPVVESVAVIPSTDGARSDVWLVVKRSINGSTKRYIEYLKRPFDVLQTQREAFFLDCGLTYDSPKTITAATKANPVVITSASHGFSNGDTVLITDVVGMTNLNDRTFTVANAAANTFELSGVNGTSYSTYVSGGKARKLVSTISGLDHLNGETVSICADGAVQPDAVVSGGAITLSTPAATVHVGYNYNSDGKMLRLDAGAADGTALGKTRRTHRVGFYLYRSQGLKIGTDFDSLTSLEFRTPRDLMSRAVPLFSGILSENLDGGYDFENQICFRQDQPFPSTILAIMPQMVTQDR